MESKLYTLIILVILGAFGVTYIQKESTSCSTMTPAVPVPSSTDVAG